MIPQILHTILQTDAQAEQGLWIAGIFLIFLVFLALWAKSDDWKTSNELKRKIKSNTINQDDYYKSLELKDRELSSEIQEVLDNRKTDYLKHQAKEFESNKLLDSDIRLNNKFKLIESQTRHCNKCYNDEMRIWSLNEHLIELRCQHCKKKFPYYDEDLDNIDLSNLIDGINEYFERREIEKTNPWIRSSVINLNFEGQTKSSPATYPFIIHSEVEAKALKRRKKTINIEERNRRIPQDIKDKVWNRDGGKCSNCGSRENLEFDHIIPFSKGGANTYRNIELLCEECNRVKSNKIG
jgi:hypothetical protein